MIERLVKESVGRNIGNQHKRKHYKKCGIIKHAQQTVII